MNRLMSGREERLLELKAEVNALLRLLGRPEAYKVTVTVNLGKEFWPADQAPAAAEACLAAGAAAERPA